MGARLLIDGDLVDSAERLPVEDPSTGSVVRDVPQASAADVEAALAAARRAADDGAWAGATPQERAAVLHRLGDLVEQHVDLFTDLVQTEVGTPQMIAELGQVKRPMDHFRDMVDRGAAGLDEDRPTVTGPPETGQRVVHEPRGVVSAITPWNAPHMLNLWKVAPALVTGNTMVLKPSPLAPTSALELGRLALEAGVPAGVLNVVTGDVAAGEALVSDPRVDMVTFTGSSAVGRSIAAAASSTFKHLLLELGGKSAALALPDADVRTLVGAVMRFVTMAGQGCGLLTRVVVPDALHDTVVAAFSAAFDRVVVGPAGQEGVHMGPVITADALDRIAAAVEGAVSAGATVARGGERLDLGTGGHFYAPTLLTDVTNDMEIAQEETFGPVISVIRYSGDIDEGVAIVNDSPYGLMGAVFTADVDRGLAVAQRIRAGQVRVNATASVSDSPFGGYKASGIGRECGDQGVLEYTETKYLAWAEVQG